VWPVWPQCSQNEDWCRLFICCAELALSVRPAAAAAAVSVALLLLVGAGACCCCCCGNEPLGTALVAAVLLGTLAKVARC
jgi:hypothetical protein